MRTQITQPETASRIIESNPKAARQAGFDSILHDYSLSGKIGIPPENNLKQQDFNVVQLQMKTVQRQSIDFSDLQSQNS